MTKIEYTQRVQLVDKETGYEGKKDYVKLSELAEWVRNNPDKKAKQVKIGSDTYMSLSNWIKK